MLELQNVSVADDFGAAILDHVSLSIRPGERVALLGPNGSGKSTLLRVACALQPAQGRIAVDGVEASWNEPSSLGHVRSRVGRVGQDPDDQMVASDVFDEVAFGPCNLGLPEDEVRSSVESALTTCGLTEVALREVASLSGGQRQLLALAGVLAMRPRYLVLDEPCSMLDMRSRRRMLSVVDVLSGQGAGVLHVTHCLEDVLAYDRVVVLEAGGVVWQGTPSDLLRREDVLSRACCVVSDWLGAASRLQRERLLPADAPLADPAACAALLDEDAVLRSRQLVDVLRESCPVVLVRSTRLEARDITYAYDDGADVLSGVSCAVRQGEVTLVVGAMGSGKSTLLRILGGLDVPQAGDVLCIGSNGAPVPERPGAGVVFQRCADQLFAPTVLDDVAFGPRNLGASRTDAYALARHALECVGLDSEVVGPRNPFALSGGQMRRVTLAGVLAMERPFLALDEPTVGLDARGVRDLLANVQALAKAGVGVVVVTHDPEAFAKVASRAYVLAEGRVRLAGPVREVLSDVEGLEAAGLEPSSLALFERALACDRGER